MRPRGEFRSALAGAAAALWPAPASRRVLAQAACVGLSQAHYTLRAMVDAGELVVCGHGAEPGANRPVNLYALPEPRAVQPRPPLGGWPDFD